MIQANSMNSPTLVISSFVIILIIFFIIRVYKINLKYQTIYQEILKILSDESRQIQSVKSSLKYIKNKDLASALIELKCSSLKNQHEDIQEAVQYLQKIINN